MTALGDRLRRRWRGSLTLRVVVGTVALTVTVVAVVGIALVNRVSAGVIEAKERSSIAEAGAGQTQAAAILDAADTGAATLTPDRLVDAVVGQLALRAGSPPLYEIVMIQAPGPAVVGPQRATNLVSTASVPAELIEAISRSGAQSWVYTTIEYLDGRRMPGLAVGSSVTVPEVGPYDLIYLFPYSDQETTIALVQSATLVVGSLLVALVAIIVWIMVREVAGPVRQASRTAARIASGDLQQRVPVRGEDEMAQLAASFNSMADSLSEQISRLENLSMVQRRFVSDVSHELRTPLTTIRMATDVLHDRRAMVDTDTGRTVELLADQVDRFEALLADLLEISRIDAGAVRAEREPRSVSDLAASAVAQVASLAAERGSALDLEVRCADAVAEVDVARIERVLRNLLSNALEYGAGRPIHVVVDGHATAVSVGVVDRGPGVAPGDLERIFDRFWRADPSRARTLGGTGLGLAISREDALLHGGFLTVASKPGRGTVFVLTVPRWEGAVVQPVPLAAPALLPAPEPGTPAPGTPAPSPAQGPPSPAQGAP